MNRCNAKLILLITTVTILYSSFAVAASENERYLGFSYSLVEYQDEAIESDEVESTAVIGRFGHFFYDNFSVEGRLGDGFQSDRLLARTDSGDDFNLELDVEVDYLLGAYGLLHFNSGNDISYYGILGYTRIKLIGESNSSISVVEDESGLSYGFGVDIYTFNFEVIQYLDEDDFDIFGLSVGFTVDF
jgi:hypothetical protein